MKFPAAARPGEMLTLAAKRSGGLGGLLQFDVEARSGERVVASGSLILNETSG
jgi:hypothetical protein